MRRRLSWGSAVCPPARKAVSPSLGGGQTPETCAASSDMPPHHPACMRSRSDARVALLPPRAPVPPNPVSFDHGSTPLTLHGRALSSGPIHPVVLGQPIGTLWSNIRARPTARSPPCRPDASVSPLQVPAAAPSVRGRTPRTHVPPLRTCHHPTPHV